MSTPLDIAALLTRHPLPWVAVDQGSLGWLVYDARDDHVSPCAEDVARVLAYAAGVIALRHNYIDGNLTLDAFERALRRNHP